MVAVLEFLAANPLGVSASGAARALRLNGSTCAVLLASLERARWVERSADKTYRLGDGLLSLVDAMRTRFPLLGAGEEVLRHLSDAIGCPCVLTRIHSSHILVIATSRGEELGNGSGTDRRFPIDPPYGSVAVAWRTAEEIERWLDLPATPLTRSDRVRYRRFLADVRESGYAVWRLDERDQPLLGRVREMLDELRGDPHSDALRERLVRLFATFGQHGYLASELGRDRVPVSYMIAPIFGPDGQPHYEIILQLLRPAMSGSEIETVGRRMLASAALLSSAIGGARAGRSR